MCFSTKSIAAFSVSNKFVADENLVIGFATKMLLKTAFLLRDPWYVSVTDPREKEIPLTHDDVLPNKRHTKIL